MGFGRQVAFTYFVRLVLIPAGILNSVVIARWLGPANQGVYATIAAYLAVAGVFGSLGFATAATRRVAAEPARTGALVANARLTGFLTGFLTLGTLLALRGLLPDRAFGMIPLWLFLVAGISLPFNLTSSQLQAVVLGRQRIRTYNAFEAADRLALLGASLLLLVGFGLGVAALLAATSVWAFAKLAAYHAALGREASRWKPDLALVRELGAFSLRAYVTAILSFLVLRSDIMLITALRGSADTGRYSVAVQLAEFMLVLPAAVGTLLFPRVAASSGPDSAGFTARVSRHLVVVVTLVCLVIGLAGWWVVRLLYGEPYLEAVTALRILLPGVWCVAMQGILSNDLAGRDYPLVLPAAWAVCLSVNVLLNVLWIPTYGIAGAAGASTIAYAILFFTLTLYWLRRFPEIGPLRLFVIRWDDLREIPSRVCRVLRGDSPQAMRP